jgi:serine/threonine protein kinase
MSVVYRANDSLAEREVALKVMRSSDEESRNALYLQQEFRSMSRLVHPTLVRVYDYGLISEQVPYFTMELLPGMDLSTVGKLSLPAIYHVIISLADVLAFMHARGYVHRDVKPSNVRVLPTAEGTPLDLRLMDCGLTEEQGKIGGSVAGTLSYLAPEAWLGAPTDARGDLYSLGVLAFEIAAGQLPFDASTGVRLLKTKTERPRDLRELRPDVPLAFARLVRDLLAPEPANRPASAMEVLARLSKFTEVDISPNPLTYLRTPALVGRGDELKRIRRALGEAEQQGPVALTVMGPAGAGKTRLFEEALLEAGLRGAMIARSSGRGFSGGVYGVYRELLVQLLRLPAAKDAIVELGGE